MAVLLFGWNLMPTQEYECRTDVGISRKSDLVDRHGNRWYSRLSTSNVESALDFIMRRNNGEEIDPKYAPLQT